MAEGLGANVSRIYAAVFTAGCMLGTVGGALAVPASAASLDMPAELIVEAFAIVVIGGLGSMRGALLGAVIVGLVRAFAIANYPEAEVLSIYLIVIAVLIIRPGGPFGKGAGMTVDAIVHGAEMETAAPRSGLLSFLLTLVFCAALAAAPYYASTYTLTLLATFAAYAIALLGFNILLGYTGLLSFGHAMFIAIRRLHGGGVHLQALAFPISNSSSLPPRRSRLPPPS